MSDDSSAGAIADIPTEEMAEALWYAMRTAIDHDDQLGSREYAIRLKAVLHHPLYRPATWPDPREAADL